MHTIQASPKRILALIVLGASCSGDVPVVPEDQRTAPGAPLFRDGFESGDRSHTENGFSWIGDPRSVEVSTGLLTTSSTISPSTMRHRSLPYAGGPDMIGRGGVWLAGVQSGFAMVRKERLLGLKRLLLPASYWRSAEFAYVWNHLDLLPAAQVLDVGSPKDLAIFLARKRRLHVVATDILPGTVELSRRSAAAQGLAGIGAGKVWCRVEDGRALSFEDNSFDAAYSVSVLEHIPEHGDSRTVRELARVVKPGGRIVITVPFDSTYRETFVNRSVFERVQERDEPVFFERHYDEASLAKRILDTGATELDNLELWGESAIRVEAALNRLGRLSAFLSPVEALLSMAFLHRIDQKNDRGRPLAAFITLGATLSSTPRVPAHS